MTAITTPGDHELLEMAAKAAGIKSDDQGQFIKKDMNTLYDGPQTVRISWSPLTDDGDEARLEAELGLWVSWYPAMVLVGPEVCGHITGDACAEYYDQHGGDKQAARRRAGVRAASAIGAAK